MTIRPKYVGFKDRDDVAKDNVCRNCKWAEWDMTAHAKPRVRKNMPAKCAYPLTRIALPMCLDAAQYDISRRIADGAKPLVWWTYETPCRVWEKVST